MVSINVLEKDKVILSMEKRKSGQEMGCESGEKEILQAMKGLCTRALRQRVQDGEEFKNSQVSEVFPQEKVEKSFKR